MARKYTSISCSKTDIIKLEELSSDSSQTRIAIRAQMILQCIKGTQIKDIAAEFHERPNTVILWRDRFIEQGIEGLLNRPRGRNANQYGSDLRERIINKISTDPPSGNKRWTGKLLSVELGIPPDVIWRCLRKAGIQLTDIGGIQTEFTVQLPLLLIARKDNNMSTNNDVSNKMDLEIIARIIGKDGTVIEKSIRMDDALPNIDDFDLSTREGFLSDLDDYETSILTARNQLSEEITKEYLDAASKKKTEQNIPEITKPTEHIIDMQICHVACLFHGSLAAYLMPKEHILSIRQEIIVLTAMKDLSYRKTASILNQAYCRNAHNSLKPTTLEDYIQRQGKHINRSISEKSKDILDGHPGFSEIGIPVDVSQISEEIKFTDQSTDNYKGDSVHLFSEEIKSYNDGKDFCDQIKNIDLINDTESSSDNCVYIAIDDVGVDKQKETRKDGGSKEGKRVENTVIHVQSKEGQHVLTAIGMSQAFTILMAFLLSNNLLQNRNLYFFTDGASNIRKCIEVYFQPFCTYVHMLDWYHLEKKIKELLSMAIKGSKDERKKIRLDINSKLWAGNVDDAIFYIKNIDSKYIKSSNKLDDVIGYLTRKKEYIGCYALRKELGYRNSSNPAEKANDIIVANRQKHNGMSWSSNGSGSLAAITAVCYNNELESWVKTRTIPFKMMDNSSTGYYQDAA